MNENAVEKMPPAVSEAKQTASLERAAVATFAGESLPGGEMPSNVPEPGGDFDRFLSQPVGHLAIENGNLIAKDGEGLWRLALLMWGNGLNREDETSGPYDVFRMLAHGQSVGFHPAQSLNWIMLVKGRTSIWGDAPLALANKSELMEEFEETMEGELDADRKGDLSWTCRIKLKTGRVIERTFSAEDARRAGLWGKRPYQNYPKRMIQMRARSWALRDAVPEALMGFAVYEELADESFNPSKARGAPPEGRMHLRPNPAQAKENEKKDEGTLFLCRECGGRVISIGGEVCPNCKTTGNLEPYDDTVAPGGSEEKKSKPPPSLPRDSVDDNPDDEEVLDLIDEEENRGEGEQEDSPSSEDPDAFGLDLEKPPEVEITDVPPEPTDQDGRFKILVGMVQEYLIGRWPQDKITLKQADKLTRHYLKERGAKPQHLENDQTYEFLKKKIPSQNWDAWRETEDKV